MASPVDGGGKFKNGNTQTNSIQPFILVSKILQGKILAIRDSYRSTRRVTQTIGKLSTHPLLFTLWLGQHQKEPGDYKS